MINGYRIITTKAITKPGNATNQAEEGGGNSHT